MPTSDSCHYIQFSYCVADGVSLSRRLCLFCHLKRYCSLSRSSYFLALIPCLLLDLAWAFRSLDSTFNRLSLQQNVFSAIVMKLVGTLLRYENYHRWPINIWWHLPVYCEVTSAFEELQLVESACFCTRPGRSVLIIVLERVPQFTMSDLTGHE